MPTIKSRWNDFKSGWDADVTFSYATPKYVQIRDRRLGLVYISASLAALGYVLYSIVAQQLYLNSAPPIAGAVRITLKPPTADAWKSPGYCTTYGAPCVFLDQIDVRYPESEEAAIFVTTKLKTYEKIVPVGLVCSSTQQLAPPLTANCSASGTGASSTSYVADIESYTLMLDHSVRSDKSGVVQYGPQMKGELLDQSKKILINYDDAYRATNVPMGVYGDVMTVKDLLTAAGITSLDSAQIRPNGVATGETLRQSGLVITIAINYENRESDPSALKYTYVVSTVTSQEYKVLQTKGYNATSGQWTVWDRKGIRIVVVQTGSIGRFNFLAFLSNLVAVIPLITSARILVELLMMYVMPEREMYGSMKYEQTEDMQDWRKKQKRAKRDARDARKTEYTYDLDPETGLPRAGSPTSPTYTPTSDGRTASPSSVSPSSAMKSPDATGMKQKTQSKAPLGSEEGMLGQSG
ncbi:cytochrome c oxidase subunit 1 [Gonapodya sp. JEL0774]|nr:cytochrome c oxidase subunit 1 [Gonapodya sp. JEL0774]